MGKTKIKTIDDSVQEEVKREPQAKRAQKDKTDSLVEKLKEELGVAAQDPPSTFHPQKPTIRSLSSTVKKTRSKRYKQALAQIDQSRTYLLKEAVALAQKTSYTKFPGTVEAHMNTNVKNTRILISLPYFKGKKLTILAFGPSALPADGVIMGNDDTIEQISKGKIDFDVVIATPEWMSKLAKVAKVLGPKGLMPNPKNGTITDNLQKTVTELQSGKVELKSEPNGNIIHLAVGKVSQSADEVGSNIKTLYNSLGKSKVKKITLSATMGPGVRVDLSSI